MQSGRRSIRSASIAAALSLSLALSACASTPSGSPSTTGTKAPIASTSIPATTTTTTLAPTSVAVLNAYRAGWAAFEHALADANPSDPELAATMVDPQLQGVRANLLADRKAGMVGRGTTTLHPKIIALSATTATVVDCAYSTAELLYATTGKPVPPVTPPENDGVRSILVLSGSTWKVSKQTVTEGTCAPGS
jgi:hypothetical protein